jgi:ABC-type multidrug transport system, ATPase component
VLVFTDSRTRAVPRAIGDVSPAEFTPKSVETEELRTALVYRFRVVVQDADQGLRQGMPSRCGWKTKAWPQSACPGFETFPGLDAPALAGICGSIEAGIITGIAGPDGAGKTTLMRLMAGLLRPDWRVVTVLGLEPLAAPELRLRVGYMPQKFGLYEDLSVMENLTLHADLRNLTGEERAQTFARLLAFTDLKEFTTAWPGGSRAA